MDFRSMSDRAILREIGRRFRRRRLEKNISQQSVAETAGLNRMTVSEFERGKPASTLTMVLVLRVLNALDELEAFLPDLGLSPLEVARLKGKKRLRASHGSATKKRRDSEW